MTVAVSKEQEFAAALVRTIGWALFVADPLQKTKLCSSQQAFAVKAALAEVETPLVCHPSVSG